MPLSHLAGSARSAACKSGKSEMDFRKCLYIFGLGLSIVASFLSLSSSATCASCGGVQLYIAGVPLAWIGTFIYLGLLLAGLMRFASQWVLFIIATVSGAHIAILTSFPNHPCVYCKLGLVGSLLALLAIWTKQKLLQLMPILSISGGMVVISMIIQLTNLLVMESPKVHEMVETLNADPTFDRSYINIVAYESNTCGLCRAFNSEYEPRLLQESHKPLRFFHKTSTAITAFPTIIIVGHENNVYMGLPPYDKLLADIKSLNHD